MADPSTVELFFMKAAAGAVGAAVSLKFIVGSVPARVLMFLGGSAASYYGGEWFAGRVGMSGSVGFACFLLGLFSMPLASRVYEAISLIDVPSLMSRVNKSLKKREGGQ